LAGSRRPVLAPQRRQRGGSDPQSDVVLPASAPKRAGVLRFANGKVNWESSSGEKLPLHSDLTEHPDVVGIGGLTFTIIEREGRPASVCAIRS